MWFYLPFYTSFTTTKPQSGPLCVTRMQTVINVIERSKKRLRKIWGEKKMRKEKEKKWQQKEKNVYPSLCYCLITLHTLAIDSCLKWYTSFDSDQGIYCIPSSMGVYQDRIYRNKGNHSRFLVWKWLVSSKAHVISYSLSWEDFVYFGKDWLRPPKYLGLSVVTQLALLAACIAETRT